MSSQDKLASKLREIVGEAHVIEDPKELKALAVEGMIPKVLVSPRTIDETSKAVAYACAEKMAVIPIFRKFLGKSQSRNIRIHTHLHCIQLAEK